MEEGIKIVVAIMVAMIIAYAVIFVFSERLVGANENIFEPTERESSSMISITLCRIFHGSNAFEITGDNDGNCGNDCPGGSISVGSMDDCIEDIASSPNKCCCNCG